MKSAGSILTTAPLTPGAAVLGPFPDGSILRGVNISSAPAATSVQLISIRLHAGQVGTSGSEIATGYSLLNETDVLGTGANAVGGCRLGTFGMTPYPLGDQRFSFNEVLSQGEQGTWLSIMVDDSIAAASFLYSVDVEVPRGDYPEAAKSVSKPGSVKAPTPSGKLAKGPQVVNRVAVPLPAQSGGKPSPQPTPRFGK